MKFIKSLVLAGLIATASGGSHGHGDESHAKKTGPVKKEQKDWGIAGDAKQARRTIDMSMNDTMRFTPDRINVREGETVRFVLKNQGQLFHELVIGTKIVLDAHSALMAKFPNMEHDEPYMAHVPPGKSGEIIWTFNRPGEYEFACLIAGHYQAGMKGRISVAVSAAKGDGHDTHKH